MDNCNAHAFFVAL